MSNKIRILVVEPFKEPYQITIEHTLKNLQRIVGGYIEILQLDHNVDLICNDEGKINGLPLNRAIYNNDGEMIDIIAGNFLVVGLEGENFASLDADLMKKYCDKFKNPEQFFRLGNEIVAIPVKPSIKEQLKDDKSKNPDVKKTPMKNKNADLEV